MNFSKKISKFVSGFLAFSLLCSTSAFADKGKLEAVMESSRLDPVGYEIRKVDKNKYTINASNKKKPVFFIDKIEVDKWKIASYEGDVVFRVKPKPNFDDEEIYAIKDVKTGKYIYEFLELDNSDYDADDKTYDSLGLRGRKHKKLDYVIRRDWNRKTCIIKKINNSYYDQTYINELNFYNGKVKEVFAGIITYLKFVRDLI